MADFKQLIVFMLGGWVYGLFFFLGGWVAWGLFQGEAVQMGSNG